jgi:AcrR family transcriptional regulator
MASGEALRRASYGPLSQVVGERGARTREAIVEAALELFAERGFHATSVDDIANAVEISRSGLYQYFESKEQLFDELLHECGATLLRVVRRLGPLGPTAMGYDNLSWWLGEWAWVYDKYSTMFVQWANVDSPRAPLRPLIVKFVDSYADRMAERVAASGVEGLDPGAAAMVLLAAVNRTNYYRHTTTLRGLADEVVLDTLATVAQLVLFPATPPEAIEAHAESGSLQARSDSISKARQPAVAVGDEVDRFAGMSEQTLLTVRRLLDSGARVFAAQSFHMASVDDIVTEADRGRGTFYKYFDDKLDLLVTLAEECATHLRAMSESFADIPSGSGRPAALREWLTAFVEFHRRYAGVFRVWSEGEPRDPGLQAMGRAVADTVLDTFDRVLGRVERPYPFCVPAGSLILLGLLERLPDQLLGTRCDLDANALAELLARAIERGLLNGKVPGHRSPRAGRIAKG